MDQLKEMEFEMDPKQGRVKMHLEYVYQSHHAVQRSEVSLINVQRLKQATLKYMCS